MEVLLLRCSSKGLNKIAPKIPPKGMIPMSNPCATDLEKVMWNYLVSVSIGIVEISVSPYPNMIADIEITKPMRVI